MDSEVFSDTELPAGGGRCCEYISFLPSPEGLQDGGQICRPGLRLRVPPHSARFPSPAVAEFPQGLEEEGGVGGGVELEDILAWSSAAPGGRRRDWEPGQVGPGSRR